MNAQPKTVYQTIQQAATLPAPGDTLQPDDGEPGVTYVVLAARVEEGHKIALIAPEGDESQGYWVYADDWK